MRFFLLFSVVLLGGSCTKTELDLSDQVPVKLVKEITYPSRAGSVNSTQKTTFSYNAQNDLIRKNNYDGNDSLKSYYTYSYAKDTITTWFYLNGSAEHYTISYRYFSRIRKKERFGKTRLKPDVSSDSITYLGYTLTYFDECERPTRREDYSWTGVPSTYETLEYSADDLTIDWKEFNANREIQMQHTVLKSDIISETNTLANHRCFTRASKEINTVDYRNNPAGELTSFTYEYEADHDNYPTFIKIINLTDGSESTRKITYY